MEPKGHKLIQRYKKNYSIPQEVEISESMVLSHWELEKKLTSELLKSSPEERWSTFERCYTHLYSNLSWLNQCTEQDSSLKRSEEWKNVIGTPPQLIYEIGSGKGKLISYLAKSGFICKGTEITKERGKKNLATSHINLSWGISDGIHLDTFEPSKQYEAVISDQVIEHLHPDDLDAHLKSVYSILKKGGKYIISTPHQFTGPHDISKVFKHIEPKGMHLKEYTFKNLSDALSQSDFCQIHYAFTPILLKRFLRVLGFTETIKIDTYCLKFFLFEENILSKIPNHLLRRLLSKILKKLNLFSDNICLVAYKI